MNKLYILKSFSSTLAHLPGSFSAVYSSYSVENLLAPDSEERNSTVDIILGVLKTLKVKSCILHVCKFLISKPIRDQFLEIFCKFKAPLRNLGVYF